MDCTFINGPWISSRTRPSNHNFIVAHPESCLRTKCRPKSVLEDNSAFHQRWKDAGESSDDSQENPFRPKIQVQRQRETGKKGPNDDRLRTSTKEQWQLPI